MADVVAARRVERERLLSTARTYVERLAARVPVVGAVVAGSVARGDFNVWSDVDVVVVADDLPEGALDRAALLLVDAPPRVQPIGYTPAELGAAWQARNRLVLEAVEHGVVIAGGDVFATRLREAGRG